MSDNTLFKIVLNKAMALCSQREYCSHDIYSKLQAWGVGEDDIIKIIDLLIKDKFINEERFAQAFSRDKFNYNKWGKVKIASHLRSKSIPGEIIKTALDSIDNEVYIKVIKDLIAGHKKSVKAKNQYDLKGKLLRYGLSKGFESNLLYDILNETGESE
jgi:regulatory protein